MKPSNLKLKKEPKKIKKQNGKLLIQEEPDSRFKNVIFQKLYERNNASKERLNTLGPENNQTRKNYHNSRSNSNLKENKSQKRLKSSQKKNLDKGESAAKSKKINRNPYDGRKFKEYPNLIGGVLNQVNYYNINNNNNYNDNLRYKPIDDIFNEQSSISTKKEKDNNNSPNISFNSENQKNNNEHNIRKIRIEEDDNNENVDNNDDNLKFRKSDIIEKNGNKISPIISNTNSNDIYLKKENNDDKTDLNNKIDQPVSDNKYENSKEPKNEDNLRNKIILNNKAKKNKKTNYTPSHFNVEQLEKEEPKIPQENLTKEKINIMSIENNNNFMIYNDINNYINKLEKCPTNIFSIYNNKINTFDDLEIIKDSDINYICEEDKDAKINEVNENDGRLVFDNDDEVLDYIKKRIKEEKDEEYNTTKYNYFILTKIFHGKILYEIGLENNIDHINSILQKENVEIEHQPVVFIKKSDLETLKNKGIYQNNDELENVPEEIKNLKNENEKLKRKMELINKNFEEKNNDLINEYNKLAEEIENLNALNQKLENELNEKQNIINEYSTKFQEYNKIAEDNNRLLIEREKFTKYIYELQEYDEKVIIEYKKLKQELEIEKNKNKSDNAEEKKVKYFDPYELAIISNDLFDIINLEQKIKNNNTIYEIENIIQENLFPKIENEEQEIQNDDIEENYKNYYGNNINEEENLNKLENEQEGNNLENEFDSNNNQEEIWKKEEIEEKINDKVEPENKEVINNNSGNNEPYMYKKKNKVTFGSKKIESEEDLKKREESLSRAMQRINNKRRLDKMKEDENKFRKSKKIQGMAGNLGDKLGKGGKLYVDLEYERNKSDEEQN